MNRKTTRVLMISVVLFAAIGCSSMHQNPITTENERKDVSLPVVSVDRSETNRSLLGVWEMTIDTESLTAQITPNRQLFTHLDVTDFIPHPVITVNGFNPITNVIDVDVKIKNPYATDGYDVRLIIYTDEIGHQLINSDDWTPLYDIPGGMDLNPFIAYATSTSHRVFSGFAEHTENLLVYLPQGNISVAFAIDASIGGNCEEPFSIFNFTQEPLYALGSNPANAEVGVLNWQGSVSEVNLMCEEITGEPLTPFTEGTPPFWQLALRNNMHVPAGVYSCFIMAKSSVSGPLALYDHVEITVTPGYPDPYYLEIVGSIVDPLQDCYRIFKYRDFAYIDIMPQGRVRSLKIVDLNDPANPSVATTMDIELGGIAFRDHYAYAINLMSGQNYGLNIIDISNPAEPEVVGIFEVYGQPYYVAVYDNYAYITQGSNGYLTVVDISEPTDPVLVEMIAMSYMWKLLIYNNYLIMGQNGLTIYDLTDPEKPVQVANFNRGIFDFEIQDNYLYTLGYPDGLIIRDISDPVNSQVTGEMDIEANEMYVDGDRVYISKGDTITIADISDPSNPSIVTEYNSAVEVIDYVFSGDAGYIVNDDGLYGLDVSDPYHIESISDITGIGPLSGVGIVGDQAVAYFLDNFIIDISDPTTPCVMATFDSDYRLHDFQASDDLAYVTTYKSFEIWDITDLHNPVTLSAIEFPDVVHDFVVDGEYGYIQVGYDPGVMQIVDISDPYSIILLGSYDQAQNIFDHVKQGDYIYIADGETGLHVVDVSDPNNPILIGNSEVFEAASVTIQNNYAYVLEINGDLYIYNISDPANPSREGIFEIWYSGYGDIEINDNFLYVSRSKLRVYDISDPVNPVFFTDVSVRVSDFTINDNFIYLVGHDGFYIVELL